MALSLVSTTITDTHVRMRLADHKEADKATQWLEFQVQLKDLEVATSATNKMPLGDPEIAQLLEVHLAALRRARDVIGAETQRYSKLRDHNG